MVAERVKMIALAGGDYVLSAGKELAYEFTRVIINQHKLNEARTTTASPPHNCGGAPPQYPPYSDHHKVFHHRLWSLIPEYPLSQAITESICTVYGGCREVL